VKTAFVIISSIYHHMGWWFYVGGEAYYLLRVSTAGIAGIATMDLMLLNFIALIIFFYSNLLP
jgi:hypothetical protein